MLYKFLQNVIKIALAIFFQKIEILHGENVSNEVLCFSWPIIPSLKSKGFEFLTLSKLLVN